MSADRERNAYGGARWRNRLRSAVELDCGKKRTMRLHRGCAKGRNASVVKGPAGEAGLSLYPREYCSYRLLRWPRRSNIPHDLQITPTHTLHVEKRKSNQETTFRCRPRNHKMVKSHRRTRSRKHNARGVGLLYEPYRVYQNKMH